MTAHAISAPALATDVAMDAAALDVLAAAKGLRPLALLALNSIAAAVPATRFASDGGLLVLAAPEPYLALLPGPKTLRFYGNFGPGKHERVARSEAAMKTASKAPPPFPQVLALADARLVDQIFVALIAGAHAAITSTATSTAISTSPVETNMSPPAKRQATARS